MTLVYKLVLRLIWERKNLRTYVGGKGWGKGQSIAGQLMVGQSMVPPSMVGWHLYFTGA